MLISRKFSVAAPRRRSQRQAIWQHTLLTVFCLLPTVLCLSCSRGQLLDEAQAAWDGRAYELAAQRYEEFLKRNPRSDQVAFARYRVATICRRDLKQFDRAIQHYIHFIEDFPQAAEHYQARLSLAESYAAARKFREAIGEYESALPLAQDKKERRRVRLKIADLYNERKDFGQALAEYQKVLKDAAYDELSELAWLQIGGIHLLRDEFAEALPAYQIVAQSTKDDALRRMTRLRLADCYERIFQYEQAVKMLEETAPDPQNPSFMQQRIAAIREQQRQRNLSAPAPKQN